MTNPVSLGSSSPKEQNLSVSSFESDFHLHTSQREPVHTPYSPQEALSWATPLSIPLPPGCVSHLPAKSLAKTSDCGSHHLGCHGHRSLSHSLGGVSICPLMKGLDHRLTVALCVLRGRQISWPQPENSSHPLELPSMIRHAQSFRASLPIVS